MLFQEVIGQQKAGERLRRMVMEERLPHALMLHGPPGTGKLALALATLQYLSCTDRGQVDACGSCPSCLKFRNLAHPDLHFVFPVVSTGTGGSSWSDTYMEKWREALGEDPYMPEGEWYERLNAENKQGIINVKESGEILRKLQFKPYESRFRMMLIWLPERMNIQAANKLLKLIEEPPPDTHIIMVSEQTERILLTILSRTQLVHVPPLSEEEIRAGLTGTEGVEEGLAADAARRSGGDLARARSLMRESELDLMYFQLFTTLMRLAYGKDIIKINDWVDEVAGLGRIRQKQLLDYGLRMLRENFILHQQEEKLQYMSRREAEFSSKFSPFIHQSNVFGLSEAFNEAGNHIEANGNARLVLMDLGIKVIMLLRQKS